MPSKKTGSPSTENIADTALPATHSGLPCCDPDVLKTRIEAAAQAQKRSRAAFLASTVMSLAILIALWNAYFSWYRSFLFQSDFGGTNITQEAQKTLVDEWVRDRQIYMPLLGIKAGIGDGAVVGSISLYVICIWVMLSMRRENHVIGVLLNDTTCCADTIRNIVFHGIVGYSVFTTVTNLDAPIKELNKMPTQSSSWLTHGTYKVLIMLPAITILFVLVMDYYSMKYMASPFRQDKTPVWNLLSGDNQGKRVFMEVACIVLLLLTGFLCKKTIQFNDGTADILREYEKGLKATTNG